MRLSEVAIDDVKKYIRVTDDEDDKLISDIMNAAKGYITSYTDMLPEEADAFEEISVAFMCLCSDMYDVRTASVSAAKENPIVRNILGMHRKNLVI